MNILETIIKAAQSLHTLIITYTSEKGEVTQREVEPYSFRQTKRGVRLFAYDVQKNAIRGFYVDNIQSAQITDRTYSPRWIVEIGNEV